MCSAGLSWIWLGLTAGFLFIIFTPHVNGGAFLESPGLDLYRRLPGFSSLSQPGPPGKGYVSKKSRKFGGAGSTLVASWMLATLTAACPWRGSVGRVVFWLRGWGGCLLLTQGMGLEVRVSRAGGEAGPEVEVTWVLPPRTPSLILTWAAITYTSQISMEEVGRRIMDNTNDNKVEVSEGLLHDQQYKFCLSWVPDPSCLPNLPRPRLCSYLTVPSLPSLPLDPETGRSRRGSPLYLVLGPVHSKNVSVTWGELPLPRDLPPPAYHQATRGYKVTWRRVDGQVSHPGHSSNLVSKQHLIRGLIPGIRYEVCVGETVAGEADQACDVFNTQEDVPGPAETEGAWCWSQAHGTHWRCDVSWGSPLSPRGTITGYRVEWRDREGYTLQESSPRGSLCRPLCQYSATVSFHPSTACVIASTGAGEGWENCVPIHDIRGRVLAVLELRLLVVVGLTVLVYRLGPMVLKVVLRCCIRGLYRHVEGVSEKQHPV